MKHDNITACAITEAMKVMNPHQLLEFRKGIQGLQDMTTKSFHDKMMEAIDEYIGAKDQTAMAMAEFNLSFEKEAKI